MTSTKANRASGSSASIGCVIPAPLAEALNVKLGDEIQWTLENRGTGDTQYLVLVGTNISNQKTIQRKMYDEVLKLHETIDLVNDALEKQKALTQAYKKSDLNKAHLIVKQDHELALLKKTLEKIGTIDKRFQLLKALTAEQESRKSC